jgi:hypothetical protein
MLPGNRRRFCLMYCAVMLSNQVRLPMGDLLVGKRRKEILDRAEDLNREAHAA